VSKDKVVVIVDADDLSADHRQDVADWFQCPQEWVMTTAEFKSEHGDVDLTPPWPTLTAAESVGVMRTATKLLGQIEQASERAVASFRDGTKTEGGRGSYVTQKVKDQLAKEAMDKALGSFAASQFAAEIPKAFGRHLDESVGELQATYPDAPEVENYVAGYVTAVARYAKSTK
jgi:hypothetical protein